MKEIYDKIVDLIEADKIGAYCTVVDTKGSTPQKPGSKLLILPDLQHIGTLGGGCVEAEARQQAIQLLQGGSPRLLEFQLNSDYGWDDGLICGGSMRIFIDIPQSALELEIFASLRELSDQKTPLLFATIIESETKHEIGAKLLVSPCGQKFGSLGDWSLETQVEEQLERLLGNNTPAIIRADNDTVSVFVEPIQPRHTLLIAGAGHIGQALCHLSSWLGFNVVVVDDRVDFASQDRLPDADQIIVGDIFEELRNYPIDPCTYVVIVTRGHNHDEEALHATINSDARYIGLIGSRRKVKLIYEDLMELGISTERLDRVYAPIGLDINSKTVPEIAVSIASQLIQVRNNPKVGSRFDSSPSKMPTVKLD